MLSLPRALSPLERGQVSQVDLAKLQVRGDHLLILQCTLELLLGVSEQASRENEFDLVSAKENGTASNRRNIRSATNSGAGSENLDLAA